MEQELEVFRHAVSHLEFSSDEFGRFEWVDKGDLRGAALLAFTPPKLPPAARSRPFACVSTPHVDPFGCFLRLKPAFQASNFAWMRSAAASFFLWLAMKALIISRSSGVGGGDCTHCSTRSSRA